MSETRRSNIVVVAGTDSGVGKTWVTAALARALAAARTSVRAVKLVETGCQDAAREREDGVILARATGQDAPIEALCRFLCLSGGLVVTPPRCNLSVLPQACVHGLGDGVGAHLLADDADLRLRDRRWLGPPDDDRAWRKAHHERQC